MCDDSKLPESGPRLRVGAVSIDPWSIDPWSAGSTLVDTRPVDHYPIADESDAQVNPDECPQDICARDGHEWTAVWDGPWTSWGSRMVTVSYDECARCGAVENYWESPLGA